MDVTADNAHTYDDVHVDSYSQLQDSGYDTPCAFLPQRYITLNQSNPIAIAMSINCLLDAHVWGWSLLKSDIFSISPCTLLTPNTRQLYLLGR
jgi:hypothetical protein